MALRGVWIQPAFSGREGLKGMTGARMLGLECAWGSACTPEIQQQFAPIGSVEFCEAWLQKPPAPDFYPEFLWPWLHRQIVKLYVVPGVQKELWKPQFAKSGDRYKATDAVVLPERHVITNLTEKTQLWYLSDVVEFRQEWRYYVADGQVLATGWYSGTDDDEPAPELPVRWPDGYCGAVDFGRMADGRLALVEAHHPYACGWYGDDPAAWVRWVLRGWEFTRSITGATALTARDSGV